MDGNIVLVISHQFGGQCRQPNIVQRHILNRQRPLHQHPRAPAHKAGNQVKGNGLKPALFQCVIESDAKVKFAVDQRAIEVKADDIERKIVHD